MSKDPAVLFYTSDFISGTITMTDEQRGKYILLLCIQHQKGHLTEKDMLNICKTYDEDIWCKFKNEDGVFFNERMKEESEKRAKYAESRRDNRKKKDVKEEDIKNISSTYVPHMENENENINKDTIKDIIIIDNNIIEKEFETFWKLYDKKAGVKAKLFKKWTKLKQPEKDKIFETLPKYVASTEKKYRKNPETYLNNEAWNDEIITEPKKQKQLGTTEDDMRRIFENKKNKLLNAGN